MEPVQAGGVFELNINIAESKIVANLLLTLTQFPSARVIHSKQSHDAIDNLSHLSTRKRSGTYRHTSSLKSLSSAKRREHSLISSICKEMLGYRLVKTIKLYLVFTIECSC